MGLLDQVIGSVLGNVLGGGGRHQEGNHGGGSGAMSPLVKALLMLLAAKAMQGGFGDIFGGGRRPAPQGGPEDGYAPDPHGYGMPDPRDDEPRGRRGEDPNNPYSDLAGMLDGPGGGTESRYPSPSGGGMQNPFDQGAGPYSRLDREQPEDAAGGGLDQLIDRFRQGGLGEMIESWIGPGHNRPIQPQQLAQALGPDTVETLSRQTGMGRDDLLAQLAQVLPGVVDGLTPQGRRPNHDEMRGW
ncbi:YidB family protein [Methylobacterium frigidaeris]|uniref:DUF937 domain-containing protein n=1 Tax=Methylobacterium frigidaeris TaxID=2038277 RepID=A0AA37HD27_9HYPH|nr:YidB family protein [Methylobacterium frigidaeris]PIK69999.1 hypothetical protein CS379_26925 [Methylobacterium frigidaeris]GJD63732.1 hypothetical protein MPEAHAMD_3903 [Methylobacterium frigidaeris]